jgi:hypothetical protein
MRFFCKTMVSEDFLENRSIEISMALIDRNRNSNLFRVFTKGLCSIYRQKAVRAIRVGLKCETL